MLQAWYERSRPAGRVLQVSEMADSESGLGEVRVRGSVSAIIPGDTQKRGDWVGHRLTFPRIVRRSDGSGIINAVGQGVNSGRVRQRVWVHRAQSYRPFGTAAQLTVVPADQAVVLPDDVDDETGACLGIPGPAHPYGCAGSQLTCSTIRRASR
jgi:NADPH2:quinone reductase